MKKKTKKDEDDELAAIQKKLKTLEQEYTQNDQIHRDLYARNRVVGEEIKSLKYQLARMAKLSEGWHITDHALLRYIERKYNLPVSEVKKEILGVLKNYNLGDSDNCMGFVVRGNAVITYRSKNGSEKRND